MPTLNWIGKEKVVKHHLDVPFRILEPSYTYGDREDATQNRIIHGDNLEALKSLLPEHEGKIKCIYIDPPYNTGNESWVYNDNVNHPKIKKWFGEVVGREGDDLCRHDKWLCMIYPRLKVLGKLLSQDGTIVISIGSQEFHHLLMACREIFGDRQIVGVTVQTSGGKPSGGFNLLHEYLIFVTPKGFSPNQLKYSGGNERSPFEGLTLATFTKEERPNQVYPIFINIDDGSFAGTGPSLQERIKNGTYKGNPNDFQYDYSEAPEGTVSVWPVTSKDKDCVWRLIPSRLKKDWEKGYIKITPNKRKKSRNRYSVQYLPSGVIKKINENSIDVDGTEKGVPTLKFGNNSTVGSQIPSIWYEKDFYTVKGSTLIGNIFPDKIFDYPKSVELVSEVIRGISSSDDIILDSFAGSGTTAHAVLNLNKEDGGNRKFILVELEDYADSITAERVKRVMEGYGSNGKEVEGTGGGFTFYELGKPLFLSDGSVNREVPIDKLRKYIYFTETKKQLLEAHPENPYFLGSEEGNSYYLLHQHEEPMSLDYDFLPTLVKKDEAYIIYADRCLIDEEFMRKHNIIFKKVPRDIVRF